MNFKFLKLNNNIFAQ